MLVALGAIMFSHFPFSPVSRINVWGIFFYPCPIFLVFFLNETGMCLLTLEDAVKNRFLYDGNRINDDDTPATLDMEDGGMWFSIYYVFPI
jgi:hypothetical protein